MDNTLNVVIASAPLVHALAWPVAAVIIVIILGPTGVLKGVIAELANNFMKITSSVDSFKKSVENFNQTQLAFEEAHDTLTALEGRIAGLSTDMKSLTEAFNSIDQTNFRASINNEIQNNDGNLKIDESDIPLSEEVMWANMIEKWKELYDHLKNAVGVENFDGRSAGAMAWMLADRRRSSSIKRSISKDDAARIEHLYSNYKRFLRWSGSLKEWLTSDVYRNFVMEADKALLAFA